MMRISTLKSAIRSFVSFHWGLFITATLLAFPLAAAASDKIVFHSQRDGNREIYIMNADGTCQARLTFNDAEDMEPWLSSDGTKIVFQSNRRTGGIAEFDIFIMNIDGSDPVELTHGGYNAQPSLSPDGTRITFTSERDGANDIFVMDSDGSNAVNLTQAFGGSNTDPSFSPDGNRIVFRRDDDLGGNYDLYVLNADGTGTPQRLTFTTDVLEEQPAFSPDGSRIVYNTEQDATSEIWVMDSNGSTPAVRLTSNSSLERHPSFSPDGSRIAFTSGRDGNNEIYVMNADGSNQTRLTNATGSDFGAVWGTADLPCPPPTPTPTPTPVLTPTPTATPTPTPTPSPTPTPGPTPAFTTTYGVVTPSNGGLAVFSVIKNGNTLNGIMTYTRGSTFYVATRITFFVISGQTARIEGFSSNGRLFVATAEDGGPGQSDRFRLWIEGVEQTAGGAISNGTIVVYPWGPDTRLRGWVDLHTHPMSNLAFGGKLFHGAPSVGSLMPAVQMPADPECRFDNRATSIAEALSQDGPTRGDPFQSRCGDAVRKTLINAIEASNGAATAPVGSGGYPLFTSWPKWDDITHQKMWVDWIRRSWEGGQRVMVALSHNNRTLAEMLGSGGPISGVKNDKASSDLQIAEIKGLVAAHPDFMAVASTPAELDSIIRGGRLAVVLGVEIDKIGDFSTTAPPTPQMINAEIDRLYAQGVRYILPLHLTDNAFGDTAISEPLFNIINWRENGHFWSVGCAAESDEVGYRSTSFPQILSVFLSAAMPTPPNPPACLIPKPAGPFFTGHVNVRSPNGLTSLGDYTIRALMRRGIIIDIDHMSDRAANRTLTIAGNIPGGGYPLASGHSGLRSRFVPSSNAENSRTTTQLARIACLGGMFGLGTAGSRAVNWTAEYARGYEAMRRAFAPNGICPNADPLGGSGFLGMGTDTNSLVKTPRPTLTDPAGPRFTNIYDPNAPVNQGVTPLVRSTTGARTWDYNLDGVAHYGMFVDFLRDVRTLPANSVMNGRDIVDDQMMYGAERFYRMWLKAEAQKIMVP
jgi:WD40 repeat protein